MQKLDDPGELIVLSPEDQRQDMFSAGGLLICFEGPASAGHVAETNNGRPDDTGTH